MFEALLNESFVKGLLHFRRLTGPLGSGRVSAAVKTGRNANPAKADQIPWWSTTLPSKGAATPSIATAIPSVTPDDNPIWCGRYFMASSLNEHDPWVRIE